MIYVLNDIINMIIPNTKILQFNHLYLKVQRKCALRKHQGKLILSKYFISKCICFVLNLLVFIQIMLAWLVSGCDILVLGEEGRMLVDGDFAEDGRGKR